MAAQTMQTIAVTGPRQVTLIEKEIPRAAGDYAIVKVMAAPMCNEYLAYTEGIYLERNRPDSLGHEFAGEVVYAPAGAAVKEGDRVVALCGFPCGRCELCRRGYYSHCANTEDPRQACDSPSGECAFGQYALKSSWLLEPIPAGMSFEHASMAGCGLGPTFGAMQRMNVTGGSTVLVTGLGAVGLGGVINAKARGARVIAVGRTPYRAGLARRLGADAVVGPSSEEIAAATGGRGADFVLECSGQPEYQRLAVDSVARLGSVAMLAEPGRLELSVDEDLVQRGITLIGTLDLNRNDAKKLLELIAGIPGVIDAFITHRLPLSRVGDAFEAQSAFQTGKVILQPWAGG